MTSFRPRGQSFMEQLGGPGTGIVFVDVRRRAVGGEGIGMLDMAAVTVA